MPSRSKFLRQESGAAFYLVLTILLFLAMLIVLPNQISRSKTANEMREIWKAQAFYLAEGGITQALWDLSQTPAPELAANNIPLGSGHFSYKTELLFRTTESVRVPYSFMPPVELDPLRVAGSTETPTEELVFRGRERIKIYATGRAPGGEGPGAKESATVIVERVVELPLAFFPEAWPIVEMHSPSQNDPDHRHTLQPPLHTAQLFLSAQGAIVAERFRPALVLGVSRLSWQTREKN